MSTIATLQYNPYSNREKKGYTLYMGYAPYVVGTFSGINFNPADGVNTELILNTVSDKADYLLVLEGANNTIASRWFILDADRTRGGQYHLTLYRDVVYDNLPEVMGATAFIEKGWINDVSNPLLFNEEALPTNQRKIDEILIQDSTKTPWIVGYFPTKLGLDEDKRINLPTTLTNYISVPGSIIQKLDQDYAYALDSPTFYEPMVIGSKQNANGTYTEVKWIYNSSNARTVEGSDGALKYPYVNVPNVTPGSAIFKENIIRGQTIVGRALTRTWNKFYNARKAKPGQMWAYPVADVQEYNGKYVEYNNNFYYFEMQLDGTRTGTFELATLTQDGVSYVTALNNSLNALINEDSDRGYLYEVGRTETCWNQTIAFKVPQYKLSLTKVETVDGAHTTIPRDTVRRSITNSANYTMFCMPWNDFLFKKSNGDYMTLPSNISRTVAAAISTEYSQSGGLYDLQLVPYCPLEGALLNPLGFSGNNALDQSKMILNQAIPVYNENDEIISYYFYCTQSDIHFTKSITVGKITENLVDTKCNAQTLMHRICAPDKMSIFEYSPNKILAPLVTPNNRVITYSIYCTYKPFKPMIYVEVQSNIDSLYGYAYGDGRGLICGGDFSLPQTGDAWTTYQIQNKNYSNTFNRQVHSIELQNKYARQSDIVNAVAGTISGATGGATTGFAASGNPAGAVAGGILGGIASGIGGLYDIDINDTLRKDQLDLKKDLYQYNLENIQALPNTLLNIGALTLINKLYPYIEVYDCTEIEKNALRNKIKYNGMSVGVVTENISEYIVDHAQDRSFIKGQIIRIDLHDDYHMLKQIRQEFETGFFINRGGN